ncbi:hypothetical protein [Variovorax atrisoli]|uniref:hypothetical protein n=1 Tax=Variovorax atrisoli TaxID=3394203 RepID=UPI0040401F4A
MWKPTKPAAFDDVALSDKEAWWNEFKDELHHLFADEIDEEWLSGLAALLYPFHVDRDPREAAAIAFATLNYEVPGYELEEPFEPPLPRCRPGLH